jgi:hypothetical protein
MRIYIISSILLIVIGLQDTALKQLVDGGLINDTLVDFQEIIFFKRNYKPYTKFTIESINLVKQKIKDEIFGKTITFKFPYEPIHVKYMIFKI